MSTVDFGELKELIIEWAENRTEPFTTAEAHQEIDAIENVVRASNAIRELWVDGLLARKKIDGCRFAYALPAYAPQDFEMVQKKDEPEQAEEPACSTETILPPPAKSRPYARKSGSKTVKQAAKTDATPTPNEQGLEIHAQMGEIKLPDSFVLQLKTPGGLIITITTPGVA